MVLKVVSTLGAGAGGNGTVTQVNTGTGLTGGPITTTGTVSLVTPVEIANGGTNSTATPTAGAVAYGNGTSYLFTSVGTSGQFLQSTGSGAPTWSTPSTGSFQPAYYGTFVSTANQPNGGATTANATTFDTTVLSNGISITSNSQITFANAGQYLIAFELAVNNSTGSNPNISSWLALNGTNIANTRSDMTIQGGANNPQLLEQQWIVNVTAGQYIEIYWSSSATTVSLLYQATTSSPTRPASPSAIVNAVFIPPSGQNLVVGNSTITGGTSGYILYDNAGIVGEKAPSGTGNVVLTTSATLSNVNIASVAVTFPNSYLANSTTTLGNATLTLGSTQATVGNLTLNNVTINSGNSTVTTDNIGYANISTALRTQALTGYLYGNANTGNVTAATTIPNSGLTNASTTLGNATLTLGSTTTAVGNLTLNNANITSVAATFPNSFLANSTATLGNTTVTLGSTTTSVGNLTINNSSVNGFNAGITTKTANYTVVLTDNTVLANVSAGNITITLPTAVGATGRIYSIKKVDSSANVVTIATTASQTIDGTTTKVLSYQYDGFQLQTDGANWFIIANTFGRNGTAGTF